MEIVKQTEEYQIVKKRSGRYGVRAKNRKWITGDDKVKILVAEGLIKAAEPKKEPEPAEEAGEEPEAGADAAAEADTESGKETGTEAD